MTENDKSFKDTSSPEPLFSQILTRLPSTLATCRGQFSWVPLTATLSGVELADGKGKKMEQSRAFVYTSYAYWLVLIPSAA